MVYLDTGHPMFKSNQTLTTSLIVVYWLQNTAEQITSNRILDHFIAENYYFEPYPTKMLKKRNEIQPT